MVYNCIVLVRLQLLTLSYVKGESNKYHLSKNVKKLVLKNPVTYL